MINRLCCEIVVPILWRDPWRYSINYKNKNYLLAMIGFSLPDNIKEFLNSQGIQLPSILHQSLLFDYFSFCESINIDIMNSIICIGSSFIQFSLQQEFYNLIMRKCSELKYLDMGSSIKHQIYYFPEAKAHLKSLCELKCETCINYKFFYGLSRICQNIQRFVIINISPKTVYTGLIKLIEVQKNLKYFEWRDDFLANDNLCPYEEVFLMLEKKADILNNLVINLKYRFFVHSTLQKIILKFHKLKLLMVNGYVLISKEPSSMLIYPDLEILHIDYITISAASSIIENSGGNLKEILLFNTLILNIILMKNLLILFVTFINIVL
ncbi:hypothetical protein C1645_775614 [Glomus cerebriforme]|uniref:F-box domain-containing protein n=1 Tax=Glomus cerebriforme TaxID=658196 RepID=A0A397SR38_9GLOM|nr:hypothetical protein C1645_775614 [Glomus cerebriforme]